MRNKMKTVLQTYFILMNLIWVLFCIGFALKFSNWQYALLAYGIGLAVEITIFTTAVVIERFMRLL